MPTVPEPADTRFWKFVLKTDTCWLWQGARNFLKDGTPTYGVFTVSHHQPMKAHRWSWERHFGPLMEGEQVLHHCDTPACVRPDHLFKGSGQDNMTDKVLKDRQSKGSGHGRAKLTESQVEEIRTRFKPHSRTHGGSALAREFGVSQATVSALAHGKTWAHVVQMSAHE